MSGAKRLALGIVLGCAILPASSMAAGGTYDVVFCHELHRNFGGTIDSTNSFSARSLCSDPQNDSAIKIENVDKTAEGRSAEVFWEVAEPLGIAGVEVDARLRRADGYRSELFMADADGNRTHTVATGDPGPSDFKTHEWQGKPQHQFVARLQCNQSPSCSASEHARTWVRNVRFTVADGADPELEVEGSLVAGGWLRGDQTLKIDGSDLGAGLTRLSVTVNGTEANEHEFGCAHEITARVASAFDPCPAAGESTVIASTDGEPFLSGTNELTVCSIDFATNFACQASHVRIDNEIPDAVFGPQDLEDPELIRVLVEDEVSGLETGAIYFRLSGTTDWHPLFTQILDGELQARVNSTAAQPGTYEFMATATDVAGNTSQTTSREDGSPMTLEFPLKSGVDLNVRIEPGGSKRTLLRYGKSARVQGRLLDATGEPLAGKPIVVDEDFGEGALIDHRIRTVMTDVSGRWSSKLPAGPNRSVSVAYEGDQRYLETSLNAGRMVVRTGAKMGLARRHVAEGNSATFTGRVGRLGARVPARGKLVQIQYQDPTTGRWATVRNPFRTGSDGRFRFKYRFGTHYVQDVSIRFRLNVPSEKDWPYRGSKSGARRVIVEARP